MRYITTSIIAETAIRFPSIAIRQDQRTCTQHTRTCIYIYMWRGGGPSKRDGRKNSAIWQCHVSMKMVGVHCLSDRSSLAAKFQYNEKDCLRANSRWRNCSGGARTKILKLLIISWWQLIDKLLRRTSQPLVFPHQNPNQPDEHADGRPTARPVPPPPRPL